MPAWEPDLAGGGLPRGSPATASANATHAAWLGLREGQQGWEETVTPDHLPDTKAMCSCPPCRQKCFSYAGVVMGPRPWPLPHGAWGPLSGQFLGKLWSTAVNVTVGRGAVTSNGVALCWHPVAHVTCHVVLVFQCSLVSLGTEIAHLGLRCLSSCHSIPQTMSVFSTHAADWLLQVGVHHTGL